MTDDWRPMQDLDLALYAAQGEQVLLCDGRTGERSLVRIIPATRNGVAGFVAVAEGGYTDGEDIEPAVTLDRAVAWKQVGFPALSVCQATHDARRAKDAEKPEDFEGAFAAFEAERQEREALAKAAVERDAQELEALDQAINENEYRRVRNAALDRREREALDRADEADRGGTVTAAEFEAWMRGAKDHTAADREACEKSINDAVDWLLHPAHREEPRVVKTASGPGETVAAPPWRPMSEMLPLEPYQEEKVLLTNGRQISLALVGRNGEEDAAALVWGVSSPGPDAELCVTLDDAIGWLPTPFPWEGFDEDSPPEPDPESCIHDPVERPAHYCQGAIETIDYIESLGIGPAFCQGNAIKYLSRYRMKGGIEDLRKARWYIDRLIGQEVESKHDPASE